MGAYKECVPKQYLGCFSEIIFSFYPWAICNFWLGKMLKETELSSYINAPVTGTHNQVQVELWGLLLSFKAFAPTWIIHYPLQQ